MTHTALAHVVQKGTQRSHALYILSAYATLTARGMMGGTVVGMTRWFILAAMATVAVPVSGIHAQEADSLPAVAAPQGPQLGVLAGVRIDWLGVASPGASLDLMLDSPKRPIWLSLQFLAQMQRWNVQNDSETRRDHHYLSRVRLGLGRREGPRIYALLEKGIGVIKADPSPRLVGKIYDLTGVGLGVGLAANRITSSLEFVIGISNRADPDLYGSLGLSLQYRVLQNLLS